MGEFADKMGTKNPGDLILSEDWNQVITEIDTINTDVADVSADAQQNSSDITDLTSRIGDAETKLSELLQAIDALSHRFRRVTLNTDKANFAMGESGEITATVTAVDGSALSFSNASQRPWIDFVTVWGKLKAASGFASVGGEGGRTISVQVNAQGVAKVELRAESSGNVSEDEESSAEAVMMSQTGNGVTVAERIMAASTPQDVGLKEAYQAVSRAYDESGSRQFMQYADKYYAQMQWNPGYIGNIVWPSWFSFDYRTSVMAFVKGDNDPTTAEPSLGTAAIQLTFRDWIWPWIISEYLPSYSGYVVEYRNIISAGIGGNYKESSNRIMDRIGDIVKDKGKLARQRDLKALDAAVEGINISNPPEFLPVMTKQLQDTLIFQQAFSQLPAGNAMEAITLFTNMDARSTGEQDSLKQQMQGFVADRMSEARQEIVTEVRASQKELKDELFSESNPNSISGLQRRMTTLNDVVAGFQHLDATMVSREIVKVEGLNQRLMQLENPR